MADPNEELPPMVAPEPIPQDPPPQAPPPPPEPALDPVLIEPSPDVQPWFPPVVEANPVPEYVEDYQFAGQACAAGFITAAQKEAWIGPGTVPQNLVDPVNAIGLSDHDRERVLDFLRGATRYPRRHPNTEALGAILFQLPPGSAESKAALDDFFRAAFER